MKMVSTTMKSLALLWMIGMVSNVMLDPGIVKKAFFAYDIEQKPAENISVSISNHATMNCSLNFPQDTEIPYKVEWRKNGELIFTWQNNDEKTSEEFKNRIVRVDENLRNFGRGSINITAIRETDSGWYECKVEFPNRSPPSRNNGTWFHLTIDGPILISVPPVNQTVMENSPAIFPCIIKDTNTPVQWYKDKIPISEISNFSGRSLINTNGSLYINVTKMGDLGEYTCEVINSTGFKQNASAYLDVQYKAKVIFTSREIFLPYGKPAILDCHFRANPPLTGLQWFKDEILYHPFDIPGVYFKPNGSLYFDKVNEEHAGMYKCTPKNIHGTEGSSPSIKVVVQRPPSFTTIPRKIYVRKLGETVEMPCEAQSIYAEKEYYTNISWSKMDGLVLPEGRYTLHGGNLTLSDLRENDRGYYKCSASNNASTVDTETELMIENIPPRVPYNLIATSTQDSVTLSWTRAFTAHYMKYSVWYKPVKSENWRTTSESRSTGATIGHLKTGVEYEFKVLRQDEFSDGMFSKTVRVWTEGGDGEHHEHALTIPMGPPRNLSVTLTADGYLLSWFPPIHGVDSLRDYVVRLLKGTDQHVVKADSTPENQYLIKDLEEDEVYHFEVDSHSIHDQVQTSERISVHVPAYGRIRAAVAGVGCILLLILIGGIVWYSRHRFLRKNKTETNKDNKKYSNGDN